jgi:uncharacterized membrane protein
MGRRAQAMRIKRRISREEAVMESKTKVLGQPLHTMLVAFPVTFYLGTLVTYSIHALTGVSFWFHVGIVTNICAVITAGITAVPGFIDWAWGIPRKDPAKVTGFVHMLLNVTALLLFLLDALMQTGHWGTTSPSASGAVALASAGVVATVGAVYLGLRVMGKPVAPARDDNGVPAHPARHAPN